jgi:hypothetical protein
MEIGSVFIVDKEESLEIEEISTLIQIEIKEL